jgi:hypothetical protein
MAVAQQTKPHGSGCGSAAQTSGGGSSTATAGATGQAHQGAQHAAHGSGSTPPSTQTDTTAGAAHTHGSQPAGGTPAAPPHAHGGTTDHAHGPGVVKDGKSKGIHKVRNKKKAKAELKRIEAQIKKQFPTQAAAEAAGYVHKGKFPDQHWNYQGTFGSDAIGDHSGAYDLSRPGSLMYNKKGQLIGVMIVAKAGEKLPDYGAGKWHNHGGGTAMIHVWFDKPLNKSFG